MQAYEELEQRLGEWCGNSNVVACSSGTSALQLALETLDLPKGSEVILPEYTMIACARAVTMAGLVPVFVDCKEDLTINGNNLAAKLTDKTKAVMVVHVYGRECDMFSVNHFADRYGLAVIEDLAEAHGLAPNPRTDAACWSFYKNKIVAGEEGGAIAFHDEGLMWRAKELRCLGLTDAHNFIHTRGGMNARLSNANAQQIIDSLNWFPLGLTCRIEIERWYNEIVPREWQMPARHVPWVYDVRLPTDHAEQTRIVTWLNEQGVPARHGFRPMSEQPEYLSNYKHLVAYRMSKEVMYLPIYPDMTKETTREYAENLIAAVAG